MRCFNPSLGYLWVLLVASAPARHRVSTIDRDDPPAAARVACMPWAATAGAAAGADASLFTHIYFYRPTHARPDRECSAQIEMTEIEP
jgi:hypothetical protein